MGIAVDAPGQAMLPTFCDEIVHAVCRFRPVECFDDDAFDACCDEVVKVNSFLYKIILHESRKFLLSPALLLDILQHKLSM